MTQILTTDDQENNVTQVVIYGTLHERQRQFADTEARYRLYGGAKGWGKSHAMRAECVKQCLSAPGIRGAAFRRTYPEIEENMINPIRLELPGSVYQYHESKHVMRFLNHEDKNMCSTLKFAYCQTKKDVYKYQGIEFDFICIEELTHRTYDEFLILMWCLRTSKSNVITNAFFSSNPGNIGHARVKRLFIDRDFKGTEKPENYKFIPAKVWDNPTIVNNNPEYVDDLKNLPEVLRKAYLDGNWDVFEWQFFREFNRDIHVVEPYIPKTEDGVKKRIVAIDFWYLKPSAVYRMALMNSWKVVIYRELYATELTHRQLALRIKAMTPADETIDKYLWDPAAINKRSESNAVTAKQEFSKVWIPLHAANNSRIAWWNLMREYLKVYQDHNTGELTSDLQITANCLNLIRTLPDQIHDKTKVEDLDTDNEDHAVDSTRYWLADLWRMSKSMSEVKSLNDELSKKKNQPSLENKQKYTTHKIKEPESFIIEDDDDSTNDNVLTQTF